MLGHFSIFSLSSQFLFLLPLGESGIVLLTQAGISLPQVLTVEEGKAQKNAMPFEIKKVWACLCHPCVCPCLLAEMGYRIPCIALGAEGCGLTLLAPPSLWDIAEY